jgi:carbamoyl-phosphate synthase large subunit
MDLFRRALAEQGLSGAVLATDMSPRSAAFHHADRAFIVPRCTSDEFVPEMLELCRRQGVRLVVPTIDTELPALARARSEFAAVGVTVAVSRPETVAIGADKRLTHTWLVEHDFPTVRQAEAAAVAVDPGDWDFPAIVKPVWGSASIGVRSVKSVAELAGVAEDVVVQSLAPGQEHTVDLFVDAAGQVRCVLPRRRLEVRGGEVSKAVTVHHAGLEDLVSRIGATLPGARGALNVQVFVDGDHLAVIEVNPRFGGGYPLSWQAGAHFPAWLLAEVTGRSFEPVRWQEGVVMLRYDDAVFVGAGDAGL